MTTLERIGYGSSFNTLTIYENTIKKQSINPTGHVKLNKEIDFYEYVCLHSIPLCMPRLISSSKEEHQYSLTFMREYVPLYTIFPTCSNQRKEQILHTLRTALDSMHARTVRPVDRSTLMDDLQYEFYDKLLERYTEVEPLLRDFTHIRTINGKEIKHLHELVPLLYQKVIDYYSGKQSPEYCLIHGDCQFNNILINPATYNIVFIDPRASFGRSGGLFGLREYDYAKVNFALSGYDSFDNRQIDKIDIEGHNVNIEDLSIYKEEMSEIQEVLVALIWLGNAHCFKRYPCKAAYSYFYGLYLANKVLYK